jgi:hypothetical protein
MTEAELRQLARERAKAKTGFYVHFSIYVIVNVLLFSIWYMTLGPNGFPWFIFPLIGWGIGVTAHGIATFYGNPFEERMTERELSKLKAQESKKDEKK